MRSTARLLVCAFLAAPLTAQEQVDLLFAEPAPPGQSGSYPKSGAGESIDLGGFTLFVAETQGLGAELFRTDGTAAGTQLVRDLEPGPNSGRPHHFVHAFGEVFFFAQTEALGMELWKTDGTTAGTQLVVDLAAGFNHGVWHFGGMRLLNGELVFIGRTAQETFRMYRSDGTAAGTQPVLTALTSFPGTPPFADAQPNGIPGLHVTVPLKAALVGGVEPWITDGTTAGTHELVDLNPTGNSNPREFVGFAGSVYFTADDGVHGRELWVTDGTAAGTQLVHDGVPGPGGLAPQVSKGVEVGGAWHYFAGDERLWQLAAGGGAPVAFDLPAGVSLDRPDLFEVGGRAVARTKTASGRTLHAFDPSTSAWTELTTIPTLHPTEWWEGRAANGQLYFRNYAQTTGFELWTSDGTPAGTGPLASLTPGIGGYGPRGLFEGAGGAYFFQAVPGVGEELHFATPTGVTFVADIETTSAPVVPGPEQLTPIGGLELYGSSGTNQAFLRWSERGGLQALTPGRVEPQAFTHTSLGPRGTTFFTAETAQTGRELWRTTGSTATTRPVLELNLGPAPSYVSELTELDGVLYFQARTQFDYKLFRSDGTAAGTSAFFDLVPGSSSKGISYGLTAWHGRLVFGGVGPNNEWDVYTSDGTASGTQRLADQTPYAGFGAFEFVDAETHLAWVSPKAPSTIFRDLWAFDGTTVTKLDQFPETLKSVSDIIGYHQGEVYVFAETASGYGFWRVDVQTGAAHKLGPFTSGLVYDWALVEGAVFVVKEDFPSKQVHVVRIEEATQSEVYLTAPIQNKSYEDHVELVPVGERLYFTARESNVQAIRHTDGTVAGTHALVSTLTGSSVPGTPWTKEPRSLRLVGGGLAFVGNDFHGSASVYAISNIGAHALDLGPRSGGHTLRASVPKLGSVLTFSGSYAPAGPSVLYLQAAGPVARAWPVAAGSLAWLDPAASTQLTTTHTAQWSFATPLPATPALVGSAVTVQSWSLAATPVTSNALMLTLGS